MSKTGVFFPCCFLIFFASASHGFTEQPLIIPAAQAQTLTHNSQVALRGNIIFGLGEARYVFRDSSGDMVVKVEDDIWGELSISPFDRIEIDGELKRDERNWHIELDVISIRRAVGVLERGAAELEHLFMWPVIGRVSSPYGNRRSPITGRQQFHTGIDITAPRGTPVRAAMSGRVSIVGRDNVYGNYIIINHHTGLRTLYAHLNVTRVTQGVYVATGEHIGDVGTSGLSTGPHLHFGVFRNNATVNPRDFLR